MFGDGDESPSVEAPLQRTRDQINPFLCLTGFAPVFQARCKGEPMSRTLLIVSAFGLTACNQGGAGTNVSEKSSARPSSSASATEASAEATRRVITCHELIGGKPSPEATTYKLVGDKFYSQAPGTEEQLISREGEQVNLGRSENNKGRENSLASHTLQGNVLTRTVLWQRPGQPPRTAFVERYDFAKQMVVDDDTGEDACHHNARPDGRTQQEAEWEALSGTGRGEEAPSNAD
jgi:hypothetical protein